MPDYYNSFTNDFANDIQILYDGDAKHFICIFYNYNQNKVLVYDSAMLKRLTDTQIKIINILYPSVPNEDIEFVRPKTIQSDSSSCGVFAMAYATTLILGKDPRFTALKLNRAINGDQSLFLRRHIEDIITFEYPSLFPTE